ncbi:hypothetical protein [Leuconostoc holzapfelii]
MLILSLITLVFVLIKNNTKK